MPLIHNRSREWVAPASSSHLAEARWEEAFSRGQAEASSFEKWTSYYVYPRILVDDSCQAHLYRPWAARKQPTSCGFVLGRCRPTFMGFLTSKSVPRSALLGQSPATRLPTSPCADTVPTMPA